MEEPPLDGERDGGVADSTNQPSWELREWADEGNGPMGNPTDHPEENPECRYDVVLGSVSLSIGFLLPMAITIFTWNFAASSS